MVKAQQKGEKESRVVSMSLRKSFASHYPISKGSRGFSFDTGGRAHHDRRKVVTLNLSLSEGTLRRD